MYLPTALLKRQAGTCKWCSADIRSGLRIIIQTFFFTKKYFTWEAIYEQPLVFINYSQLEMLNSWSQMWNLFFEMFIQGIFHSYDRQQMKGRREWIKCTPSPSLIQQWKGNRVKWFYLPVQPFRNYLQLITSSLLLWTTFRFCGLHLGSY